MNVFKIFFVCILLLVGSYICSAQEIGLHGGFNLSQFQYKAWAEIVHKDGATLNPGFSIGPILELPLKNMFSLETGILLTTKGNKITGANKYLFKENMYYLDVPVLLKATIPIKKIKIFGMAGVYAGSALYGNRLGEAEVNSVLKRVKVDINWGNKPNEYKRLDYGLKFGTGIKVRRYQIGASYEIGLKDFWNDDLYKVRNRVLEFYIAYQLKDFKKLKQSL